MDDMEWFAVQEWAIAPVEVREDWLERTKVFFGVSYAQSKWDVLPHSVREKLINIICSEYERIGS
jgi:hypothetical protein